MAFLSIIIPVYNKVNYFDGCIESILSQSFVDFELILVNDGSTDGSGEKCDYYESIDSRIQVFHQKNQGVSAARNFGIKEASGEYIGFIDADDTIESNMYEMLINNALNHSADISICRIKQSFGIQTKRETCQDIRVFDNNAALSAFFKGELDFNANNKIYSKKITKKVIFEGQIFEDVFFTFQAFLLAKKSVIIQSQLYNYITRDNSVSISGLSDKYLETVFVTKKIVAISSEKAPYHLDGAKALDFVMNISLINLILLSETKNYTKEYEMAVSTLKNYSEFLTSTNTVRMKHKVAYYLFNSSPKAYFIFLKMYCLIFPSDVGHRV